MTEGRCASAAGLRLLCRLPTSASLLVAVALGVLTPALHAPAAQAATSSLDVGVGRADITPPLGYFMMGWVRSDGRVIGQHTRLWARVIVLQEGGRKVALVAEDLNGIAGGMMADAAALDGDIGFSEQNVIDSASHTHAAPTGFYNYTSYNSVAPSTSTPTSFNLTGTMDPQLYAFEVRQLALAIRRANADLGPGTAGWGYTQLLGLTQNRSLEAHLADFGIHDAYGVGKVSEDPGGYPDTIDPDVNVLRVDKSIGGVDVPVGMWSTFANHGTVNRFQFSYYNEDHHGPAMQLTEAAIRASGHVPASQDVIDAYGNSDEGDQTAGLVRWGPAAAEYVGQVESKAFLDAWKSAGQNMSSAPTLDWRWTRTCWCGQSTPDGAVATQSQFGLPQITGSEEGRGPLFDITRIQFEGDHLPFSTGGPFGDEIKSVLPIAGPPAVPMMALRVADHMIVSIPGEMTVEMGRRTRSAVALATIGAGINRVVISGLANEYASYFTTPEEFDAQHYEGASTIYGRASSDLLESTLAELAHDVVAGTPAPAAYPLDPRNGVSVAAAPFAKGAATASVSAQPAAGVAVLGHATFSWHGGPNGEDRPLDRPFVTISRLVQAASQPASPPAAIRSSSCSGRRVLVVHLRARAPGVQGRSVIVIVNRHRSRPLRGSHRRVRVDLRRLPRQIAHVRIVVTTTRGRYTLRRTYHPCTKRLRREKRRRAARRRAHRAVVAGAFVAHEAGVASHVAADPAWQAADSDLGLDIRWSTDANNVYTALWEPPLGTPPGTYRFEITANGYSLTSGAFTLVSSSALRAVRVPAPAGKVAIVLAYPPAAVHENVGDPAPDATADLTYRPATAANGSVRLLINGQVVDGTPTAGGTFEAPAAAGASVDVLPQNAQDGDGNRPGGELHFTA
ncbi:MAG: neutral/alkaline non-lysosomal ceramidase N-terminal domain-containing protein [Solirubrobacteraceae bacterium]